MNMEVWLLYLHRFVEDVDDEMKNVKNTIGHYHAHILMCNMRNHTTYTYMHTQDMAMIKSILKKHIGMIMMLKHSFKTVKRSFVIEINFCLKFDKLIGCLVTIYLYMKTCGENESPGY